MFCRETTIFNKLGWAAAQSRLRQLAWSLVWHIAISYFLTSWHLSELKLSFVQNFLIQGQKLREIIPFPVFKTSCKLVGKSWNHLVKEIWQNYNTCPKTVFPTKSSRFHEMLAIICFEQILQNISHNCELIMEIIHLSRFSEVQGLHIHLAPMWEGFKTCTNCRIIKILTVRFFIIYKH